ncbi:MAG: hypothetical protein RIS70_1121 [Planctomycetota bacterium]
MATTDPISNGLIATDRDIASGVRGGMAATENRALAPAHYWCERTLKISVQGPNGTVETSLNRPYAIVGSHPLADVYIPPSMAAKREIYLHATDQGVFAMSLVPPQESRASRLGWIDDEQGTTVGQYHLLVKLDTPPAGLSAESTVRPPALTERDRFPIPRGELLITTSKRVIGIKRITRPITIIGRADPSSLRIADNSISGTHTALFSDGKQLWAVDLLSGNGTLWHRSAITAHCLATRDSIKIGRFRLTLKPSKQLFDSPDNSDLHDTDTSLSSDGSGASEIEIPGEIETESPSDA